MNLVLGVDEAGRGPVIGPMVMAAAMLEENRLSELKELGVKDSKLLTPEQREQIFIKLKDIVKFKIVIISPQTIDEAVSVNRLNFLEADKSSELVNALKPDIAYVDCPSTNVGAYNKYLESKIKGVKIVAEHKADLNYVIVGAASILAKVTRDREIEKLKHTYKIDFGSGYPSDPKTKNFIKNNYKKYNFFRKSWATYKALAEKEKQGHLSDF